MSATRTNQLSLAEIQRMPADAIQEALRDGRCDELLAGRDPGAEPPAELRPPGADQSARGNTDASPSKLLRSLPPEEVRRLLREGELDGLMRDGE